MAVNGSAVFLIAVIALGVGFLGWVLPGGSKPITQVTLGVWKNMPATTTELFGNQSYRNVLRSAFDVKYLIGLEAQCIKPSNHATAQLQLQYANASITTHTNTTKFVNAGTFNRVFIDNSVNWPCPGTLHGPTVSFTLPVISGGSGDVAFMVRVVGLNGGGVGDNPQLASVNVIVSTQLTDQEIGYAQSITVNGFTALMENNFVTIGGQVDNFNWVASDGTTVQVGSGSCSIPAPPPAVNSCSSAIVFGAAFLSTPGVTVTSTDSPSLRLIFAGELPIFSTQTSTV